MPLPVDGLTAQSSPDAVRDAISASISQCMSEGGREQDECVAMAHEIARRQTGEGAGSPAQRQIRTGLGG